MRNRKLLTQKKNISEHVDPSQCPDLLFSFTSGVRLLGQLRIYGRETPTIDVDATRFCVNSKVSKFSLLTYDHQRKCYHEPTEGNAITFRWSNCVCSANSSNVVARRICVIS